MINDIAELCDGPLIIEQTSSIYQFILAKGCHNWRQSSLDDNILLLAFPDKAIFFQFAALLDMISSFRLAILENISQLLLPFEIFLDQS